MEIQQEVQSYNEGAKKQAQSEEQKIQANAIRKYAILINRIDEQIDETNEARKENTGIIGGIGDWIGEKTGAYDTGKSTYESLIKQGQEQAKEINNQILKEFNGKTLTPSQKAQIELMVGKLEKISGAKLEHVSWADAVLTSTEIKNAPMNYAIRGTVGAAEGAYEGVSGIMEITGKAIGILSAYSLNPEARNIIEDEISNIFSQFTLDNAKKALELLPKALDEVQKLPADKQVEGVSKLIGSILVPLGIGAKGIKAGKALMEGGIDTAKTGTDRAKRAAVIIAKQRERIGGVSKRALNIAGQAGIIGIASTVVGSGEVALAGTAIAGGTAVKYVGEIGASGKSKIGSIGDETRSGILSPNVISNSTWLERGDVNLPNVLLKKEGLKPLTDTQLEVVKKVHTEISKGIGKNEVTDLRKMTEELKKAGIDKNQIRVLMEKGITGEFRFDDAFFTKVYEIENGINKKGFEGFMDGLSGKDLSLEELTVIIKQNPKRFSNLKEMNEWLDLFDIKPISNETLILTHKSYKKLHFKDLMYNPKQIKAEDFVDYLSENNYDDINLLMNSFLLHGEKSEVNTFIEKILQGKIGIKIHNLKAETIESVIQSPSIDKNNVGKFLFQMQDVSLSPELAKKVIELLGKYGDNFLTPETLKNVVQALKIKIDKFNPKNIVGGYLKGIDLEVYANELRKNGSLAKFEWNNQFEDIDKRFELIYRGLPDFFFDVNLDTFFNFNFFSLPKEQKGMLYELIKEGGKYYEKIKNFKQYEEILEIARKSSK